jgi:hypothetical protein
MAFFFYLSHNIIKYGRRLNMRVGSYTQLNDWHMKYRYTTYVDACVKRY